MEEVDSGYKLIRNGKPFLIKGAAGDPDFLEELKIAGGNTLRVYDTINLKESLDKALALDIAMVVDIPLPRFDHSPEYFEDDKFYLPMRSKVEEVVRKYKDHPALLYWNIGNEIHYPGFYRRTKFFENFHSLIDLIHEIDGNHPVSTTIAGAHRNRLTSIAIRKPNLDFVSLNIFGEITSLHQRTEFNRFIWKGPYVISEWGNNGPWERTYLTTWGAAVEQNSTVKAWTIKTRYYFPSQVNNSSLGNFIFFWGKKIEGTPTWFSLFGENGLKSQAVFELENIWKKRSTPYMGPTIEDLLLNGKYANESIILTPSTMAGVEILADKNSIENYSYKWEIRHESWFEMMESEMLDNPLITIQENKLKFVTPESEGPYRIFVYITNGTEYFATANIPFYVLNPFNGK